ncbi:hypothetical protein A0H81_05632 [Grifola frondosa]|uniref:F-box domain-containing protein n=1 Tax=Grifola frondosa TaxID=5627 RepID=A0A1C7MCM7_GRIFR|nr:hypothetical protein A0H81_05632 [Grifola frondosa]
MPRNFPVELIDHVIDYLRYDTHSLEACALTCRSWLPRSRYHLFWRILVFNPPQLLRLAQVVDGTPALGALIERLIVLELAPEEWPEMDYRYDAYTKALPLLAEKLTKVKYVRFDTSKWGALPWPIHESLYDLPHRLNSLTTLALRCVAFDTYEDLFRLVAGCPNLSVLYCFALQWESDTLHNTEFWHGHVRPPKLRSIRLTLPPMFVLLDWLRAIASHTALNTTEFRMVEIDDLPHDNPGALWQIMGPSLSYTTVSFSPGDPRSSPLTLPEGTVDKYLSLAHNTELRSFHYIALVDPHIDVQILLDMLTSITSHRLEQVVLDICRFHAPPRWVPYDKIDDLLAQSQFSTVKELVIRSAPQMESGRSSLFSLYALLFPKAHARGILSVLKCDEDHSCQALE